MKTILVTDKLELWKFIEDSVDIVEAQDYLISEKFQKERKIRVVNVCQNYRYQSIGYYVSLLAQARGHKAMPSVLSIQDLKYSNISSVLVEDILSEIQKSLMLIKSDEFELSVYFGKNIAKRYDSLAKKLMSIFNVPCFKVKFVKKNAWLIKKIDIINIGDIPDYHEATLQDAAISFFNKQRFYLHKKKHYRFDVAMLVNAKEAHAPSNPQALDNFIRAGQKLGVFVNPIDNSQFKSILEYDGLFIRETTSVNNYTYRFARKAEAEGLVVIDDPSSIFKCSNKVYLAELMKKNNLSAPKTFILNKKSSKVKDMELDYPRIIKLPDSCFSVGVFKANSPKEYKEMLSKSFSSSELVIVQEYMPTDFDWRIGVFRNRVLFACRYFMAKNHWQIYNWNNNMENEGDFDVVPLDKVPEDVIKTALRVTSLIGDGLYGVDLKQTKNDVVTIEVNDNPNIDAGIEDCLLGETLYETIMQGFVDSIVNKLSLARV